MQNAFLACYLIWLFLLGQSLLHIDRMTSLITCILPPESHSWHPSFLSLVKWKLNKIKIQWNHVIYEDISGLFGVMENWKMRFLYQMINCLLTLTKQYLYLILIGFMLPSWVLLFAQFLILEKIFSLPFYNLWHRSIDSYCYNSISYICYFNFCTFQITVIWEQICAEFSCWRLNVAIFGYQFSNSFTVINQN